MRSDEIATNDMSETIRLQRILVTDPDTPATAVVPGVEAPLDPQRDLTPEQFTEFMRVAVLASHAPDELERARQALGVSADIAYPFYMPRGIAGPPVEPASAPGAAPRESPPEEAAAAAAAPIAVAAGSAPDSPAVASTVEPSTGILLVLLALSGSALAALVVRRLHSAARKR